MAGTLADEDPECRQCDPHAGTSSLWQEWVASPDWIETSRHYGEILIGEITLVVDVFDSDETLPPKQQAWGTSLLCPASRGLQSRSLKVASLAQPAAPKTQSVDSRPIVWLVEDDDHVRVALSRMLRNNALDVRAFQSPLSFLSSYSTEQPGCVLLDYCLPELNGAEVQQRLADAMLRVPVIFMSGTAGINDAVGVMRWGAVDFLEKPFSGQTLMERIREAIRKDQKQRASKFHFADLSDRIRRLSPRERQVMSLVVDGLATKKIARRLDVSHKTIEVHRSNITKKMKAESVPHLVRMVTEYRILSTNPEDRAAN